MHSALKAVMGLLSVLSNKQRLSAVSVNRIVSVGVTLLTYEVWAPAQEIRRVWVGYLTQMDSGLGQKVAAKLQAAGTM
jgi:hypothetical protein